VEQWEEQLSHTCLCTKIQSTSFLTYILSCTGILHTTSSYLIYDRLLPSWEIGFNRFDRRQQETQQPALAMFIMTTVVALFPAEALGAGNTKV